MPTRVPRPSLAAVVPVVAFSVADRKERVTPDLHGRAEQPRDAELSHDVELPCVLQHPQSSHPPRDVSQPRDALVRRACARERSSSAERPCDAHRAQDAERGDLVTAYDSFRDSDEALRAALRDELSSFKGAVRGEVLAALSEWCVRSSCDEEPLSAELEPEAKTQKHDIHSSISGMSAVSKATVGSMESQLDVEVANDAVRIEHDHFHQFTGVISHNMDAITRTSMVEATSYSSGSGTSEFQDIIHGTSKRLRFKRALGRLLPSLRDHWMLEEEPERCGRMADMVNHPRFDDLARIIIFVDCIAMAFAAGALIDDMGQPRPSYIWAETSFLIAYSLDLAARLFVHRLYFFWNSEASMNWFDFILVVMGWAVHFLSDLEGGLFRIIRLVKVGKVLRTFKMIDEIERMHTFLVCFVGSMGTLFWCIVTIFVFLYMFSLVFVEIVGAYLNERVKYGPLLKESIGADIAAAAYGESYQQYYDTEELIDQFGSVSKCMFTLVKSITGGDDWSQAYNVIAQTGEFGAALFIFFIAFFLIAVMNLITGFFVESAMECLQPDMEKLAVEKIKQEFEHASELERLCLAVDDDQSGSLTQSQFKDGIEKGKIPRLLMLLGLNKEHVLKFFDTLALNGGGKGQGLEEREVNIHSFVQGCMRLKGAATNFDLQLLSVEIKKMNQASQRTQRDIRERLVQLEQLVSDAIRSDDLDGRGVNARGAELATKVAIID